MNDFIDSLTVQQEDNKKLMQTLQQASTPKYGVLLDNVEPGSTNLLSIYKITELPELNMTASFASYEILDRLANCKEDEFSDPQLEWCLNQDILSSLLDSLNSLQEL